MSRVAISGNASGTGTFTIAAPNSNTDRTLTLPDEAGTVLTSGGAIDVNASAPADSLAIDSSGNVGIGTSSPIANLEIEDGGTANSVLLKVTADDSSPYGVIVGNDSFSTTDSDGLALYTRNTGEAVIRANGTGSKLEFNVQGTQAAFIDSSGNLLVGTTIIGLAVQNSDLGVGLQGSSGRIFTCADSHHDFNRTADGEIIRFRSAANQEGSISVSGSTVSYNGGHLARWSRLADDNKDTSIVKGTVMTNLDAMVEWSHDAVAEVLDDEGNVITEAKEAYTEENEQLNKMAVSSVEGDPNVAGVFVNWDDDDDFNDMNIAMTGDMVIRIAQGTTVQRGDLLMSAGDGTAKPQGDDIVRSKTIAKVTSTHVSHTYDDGSYLVPCVLMAC